MNSRGRACPAGILPLSLRRQDIFPAVGQSTRDLLDGIELSEKDLSILPGNSFHRTVASFESTWVGTQTLRVSIHHRLVLSLRHLILTEVKAVGQGDLMLGLIIPTSLSEDGLPMVKVPGGQKIISILIEATVWVPGVPST